MTKLVKVVVTTPPVNLPKYIMSYGTHGPLEMSIEDIFTCITKKAIVKEIIGDKEITLTLANYNKDNGTPVAQPVIQETATEEPAQEEMAAPAEPSVSEEEPVNVYGFQSMTEGISADPGDVFIPDGSDDDEEETEVTAPVDSSAQAAPKPQQTNNTGKPGKNNRRR